jgi:hypothetical protein
MVMNYLASGKELSARACSDPGLLTGLNCDDAVAVFVVLVRSVYFSVLRPFQQHAHRHCRQGRAVPAMVHDSTKGHSRT